MKKNKNPLSIKIIYWLTNIIYWLIIVVGGGVLVFNVLVYTSFFGNDLQLHAHLPVKANVLEEGTLRLNSTTHKIALVNASSQVHLINTPISVARKYGTVLLIAFMFLFYLFFTFRKFIVNVHKDIIFEDVNVDLLRHLAYGLLAFWFFAILYSRLAYAYIKNAIDFQHVEITEEYRNFAGLLMLALFVWVLSHIFQRGVKLQEDKDLTV